MEICGKLIPKEIWNLVFEYLNSFSVCATSSVCKLFLEFSNNDDLWKFFIKQDGFTEKYRPPLEPCKSQKDLYCYFYKEDLQKAITISEQSSSIWPCDRSSLFYRSPRTHSKPIPVDIPSYMVTKIMWEFGNELRPSPMDELSTVYCPKCSQVLGISQDIKIISKYEFSFFEVYQDAGEENYVEIFCQKCKKYTVWAHHHSYFSSYH
jgi:hypothetical protein